MRQYYDVYCLLGNQDVLSFIGTAEYHEHKKERFPTIDFEIPILENEAFLLDSPEIRADFRKRYEDTASLYYKGQQDFEVLLARIKQHITSL